MILHRIWSKSNPQFFQALAVRDDSQRVPDGYEFSRIRDPGVLDQPIFSVRARAERMRARLASDHQCFGFITAAGEVVSYIWISIAKSEPMEVPFRDGLNIRLMPGQSYVWDCATVPSHQRRGLYRAGLRRALTLAADADANDVYICTDEENVASVKGILGAGFKPIFELSLRRIGPVRRIGKPNTRTLAFGSAPALHLHAGPQSGLRIFVFGNGGYATMVLRSFIERNEQIVGVCSRGMGPWSRRLGSGASRLTRVLRIDPRPNFNHRDPFEDMERPYVTARRAGIPVLDSKDIKSALFERQLRDLRPDLILVAGFHRLIPPNVIAVAAKSAVNLHPSLLPRHRGGTAVRWVVKLGERKTGATAHVLSPEFDTGDILVQSACPVLEHDTSGDVELRVSHLMVDLANKVVGDLAAGQLTQRPQEEALATYEAPFHSGYQEIDWSGTADEIRRTCYAMRPRTGGMASYGGKRICIWNVAPATDAKSSPIGTVLALDGDSRPVVACRDGAVVITEALWQGRVVSASWISGKFGITAGNRFQKVSGKSPHSGVPPK